MLSILVITIASIPTVPPRKWHLKKVLKNRISLLIALAKSLAKGQVIKLACACAYISTGTTGLWGVVWSPLWTMIRGSLEESCMTLPSSEGALFGNIHDGVMNMLLVICSSLKELLPKFNECFDALLEKLRPLADGRTEVPMKEVFHEAALDVISKVRKIH